MKLSSHRVHFQTKQLLLRNLHGEIICPQTKCLFTQIPIEIGKFRLRKRTLQMRPHLVFVLHKTIHTPLMTNDLTTMQYSMYKVSDFLNFSFFCVFCISNSISHAGSISGKDWQHPLQAPFEHKFDQVPQAWPRWIREKVAVCTKKSPAAPFFCFYFFSANFLYFFSISFNHPFHFEKY